MPKFDFKITTDELKPTMVVVNISGFIDRHPCDTLDSKVIKLIKDGKKFLIFNLEKVDYLASEGVGVLFSALSQTEEVGGTIALVKMISVVKNVFDKAGCSSLIPFVENVDEAVTFFKIQGYDID